MILNSPIISGSLTVTGNIITSGSITLSGSVASSSFAATASFVALAQSASNAVSAQTASFANAFTVASTLTAQTLVVQTITSSVDFVTGSTRFGSILGNTHVFSGSVTMNPGGLFVSSSGLVGIGTTIPSQLLEVVGGEIKAGRVDSSIEGGHVSFGRSTDNATTWYIDAYGNSSSTQLRFVNVTNAVVAMTITGSNVGIGTSSPSDFIDAGLGLAVISTSGRTGLSLGSTQGTANEVLGRLSFTNTNSTNIGSKRLAYISGIRGTTDNSAYLEFGTADNALGTQRMVINQEGSVGIGTTNTSAEGNLFLGAKSTLEGGQLILQRGTSQVSASHLDNYSNQFRIMSGTDTTSNTVRVSVDMTNGATTFFGSVTSPSLYGNSYSQTSASGTTSFVNTGIFYNTSLTGFFNNGTYLLAVTGNPNGAGSSEYRGVYIGYVFVATGYDFGISSVVQRISYTQLVTGDPLNIGALTISAVFWNGTTETTQQTNATTNNQIRIKISGYNSSNIGAGQVVTLTKVI